MKKSISIILCLIMVLSVFSIIPEQFAAIDVDNADTGANVDVAGTGKTVDEAMAWVQSQVGHSIDMDGYPSWQPYQCVDLIKAYYQFLGVSPVSGDGFDYTRNDLPSGWNRYQGVQPQRGDILIYNKSAGNNYCGHVGIYESDYVTYHQNFDGCNYVVRATYKFNEMNDTYWGVVRPSFSSGGNYEPTGYFDVAESHSPGTLYVKGWVYDQDDMNQAVEVHIYVGGPAGSGHKSYHITANKERRDVDSNYPYHGFEDTIKITDITEYGNVQVYAYGINIGGGNNPLLNLSPRSVKIIPDTRSIGDDFYANIITGKNGMVVGATSSGNVNVQIRDGGDNQKWHFQRNSDGTYRITNVGQGKCLDVYGGTANFLENIQVYEANDSNAQKWYLKLMERGYIFIPKCNTASAMDVADAAFVEGRNIRDHQCNESVAQLFSIDYVDLQPTVSATYGGHTYELYDLTCNWHQAVRTCENLGGHLVTITSQVENIFVRTMLRESQKSEYLWLGACDEIGEGDWQWLTDESYSYHPWASTQPDNAGSAEHYLEMNNDGSWNDLTKDYNPHHPVFICEYDNTSVDDSLYSPVKTVTYNGARYEYYSNTVTWNTAKEVCEAKGGHLVTIEDANENQAVHDLANSRIWLGYSDVAQEGIWVDVCGNAMTYSDWADGEPNNNMITENYCEMNADSKWNDLRFRKLGFVCEYKPYPESVILDTDNVSINVGDSYQLSASVFPLEADNTLEWSSNNPTIADVDGNGIVTGKKAGFAIIHATAINGKKAPCIVEVTDNKNAILGDTDGDGEVTSIDVTYIQRVCAFMNTGIKDEILMNGDVDGNGDLEIIDATYIQRYLAYMPIPYSIGEAKS